MRLSAAGPLITQISTGVGLALYAADGRYAFEIQRAPDVSGGAGIFATIAAEVPGTTEVYVDRLPKSDAVFWYRIRHTGFGDVPSEWVGPVSASPDVLPATLTRPPLVPLAFANYRWVDSETERTYAWDVAPFYVWVFDQLVDVGAVDGYMAGTSKATLTLEPGSSGYVTPRPTVGFQRAVHHEPRSRTGRAGDTRNSIVDATPVSPPTVRGRVVTSTDRDTANVYGQVESALAETLRLFVRQGEAADAAVYGLCNGVGDSTPRYVARGTELGPTDYFTSGSDAVRVLRNISLTREQIGRVHLRSYGRDSGLRSDWLPIPLDVKEQPYLESALPVWNEGTGAVDTVVKGGGHCASVLLELDDNPSFTSPYTYAAALADGGTVTHAFALSGAERGRLWYFRARPFNGVGQTGLQGVAQQATCLVPTIVYYTITPDEPAGTGLLTVVVSDPGAQIHPSLRIAFEVRLLGAVTSVLPTTSPGGGATSGTYTYAFALNPKHLIEVVVLLHHIDGSTERSAAYSFDAGRIPNVIGGLAITYAGTQAVVEAKFDTDTLATGTGGAEFKIDSGSWTAFDVDATTCIGSFAVAMSSSAIQAVLVRGISPLGVLGAIAIGTINRYIESLQYLITPTEPSGTGLMTVVVDDVDGEVDPIDRVEFEVRELGTLTIVAPTTAPGGFVTTGTYTYAFALNDKHLIEVVVLIHLVDGSTIRSAAYSFDAKQLPNVIGGLAITYSGDQAVVEAKFDTDTLATGTGGAEYKIDSGSWTTFDVDASTRIGFFVETMSTSAIKAVFVHGLSPLGVVGPDALGTINRYSPTTDADIEFDSLVGFADDTLNTIVVTFNAVGHPSGTQYNLEWATLTPTVDGGTVFNIASGYVISTPVGVLAPTGRMTLTAVHNSRVLGTLSSHLYQN